MSKAVCSCCDSHSLFTETIDELDFRHSIHQAVLANDITKVRRRLAMKKNSNELDSAGYTPLLYCSRAGHVAIAELLIRNGACVNATTKRGRVSCLQRAILGGNVEMVKLLLSNGADKYYRDADNRSCVECLESVQDEEKKQQMRKLLV